MHIRCNVFVLAASNLPWDLDPAFLRRLEKRVYVPLPNTPSRIKMFAYYLLPPPSSSLSQQQQKQEQRQCRYRLSFTEEKYFKKFAEMTEGYSGADIKLICKEAAMRPLRRIFDYLHNCDNNNNHHQNNTSEKDVLKCLENNPILVDDIHESISSTKPTILHSFCKKYNDWNHNFGSM